MRNTYMINYKLKEMKSITGGMTEKEREREK